MLEVSRHLPAVFSYQAACTLDESICTSNKTERLEPLTQCINIGLS